MDAIPKRVAIYKTEDGDCPYTVWLEALRDKRARQRIGARIRRVESGNFGDSKAVGEGVVELRVDYGPGYRVYFGRDGNQLVILLIGGDKRTQARISQQLKFIGPITKSARRRNKMTLTRDVSRARKWIHRHPSIAASLFIVVITSSLAAWLGYTTYVAGVRLAEAKKQNELQLAKERAVSAALAGNWSLAESQIKEVERHGVSPGWVRMLNGQIALCKGNYEEALDDLMHARELLDDNIAALALVTRAYFEAGDEIAYYEHLAELRDRDASSFEELGVCAYEYLRDRINRRFELPSLATSIEAAAQTAGNGLAIA